MKHNYSENIWNILACPYCGASLENLNDLVKCSSCNIDFRYSDSGALDLRLKSPKKYHLEFDLFSSCSESEFKYKLLEKNPAPELDFSSFTLPRHFTENFISYFPKAKSNKSLVLDLGCGDTVHREMCEYAGFEYVGMDYDHPDAALFGDAHSLPFKDNSFEFILSLGVIEHVRFPFVMMKEAYRVLKPNGKFIGTVAFMEPFHGNSFYHHTHLGIFNSLQYGGFKIEHIAPRDKKWSVLTALARMALFPKMPRFFAMFLVSPLQMIHQLWWKMGIIMGRNISEDFRVIQTTGAFAFIAKKGK